MADIDRGAAAVDKAAGGKATKFFRFPGFVDLPALLAAVEKKNMPVFGTDLWASDWTPMTPEAELDLLMRRLRRAGRGVILLHDIKKQTADMLPALLAALKAEHFQLVHVVAGDAPPPNSPSPGRLDLRNRGDQQKTGTLRDSRGKTLKRPEPTRAVAPRKAPRIGRISDVLWCGQEDSNLHPG